MLVPNLLVAFVFLSCFVLVAESIYWFTKKEYMIAKAKYLREIINKKNNFSNPDQSFYSCVYENWSAKEMNLSNAHKACSISYMTNNK